MPRMFAPHPAGSRALAAFPKAVVAMHGDYLAFDDARLHCRFPIPFPACMYRRRMSFRSIFVTLADSRP